MTQSACPLSLSAQVHGACAVHTVGARERAEGRGCRSESGFRGFVEAGARGLSESIIASVLRRLDLAFVRSAPRWGLTRGRPALRQRWAQGGWARLSCALHRTCRAAHCCSLRVVKDRLNPLTRAFVVCYASHKNPVIWFLAHERAHGSRFTVQASGAHCEMLGVGPRLRQSPWAGHAPPA